VQGKPPPGRKAPPRPSQRHLPRRQNTGTVPLFLDEYEREEAIEAIDALDAERGGDSKEAVDAKEAETKRPPPPRPAFGSQPSQALGGVFGGTPPAAAAGPPHAVPAVTGHAPLGTHPPGTHPPGTHPPGTHPPGTPGSQPAAHEYDVGIIEEEAPLTNPLPGSTAESIDWDDPLSVDGEEAAHEEGEDPYIGTTIGDRYIVDTILGEGGMGRVYKAHHKIIGKNVAIKILHAELAKDKEAVGRFVREAKAASSIGNQHIVDISDFGELPDGSTYFVMEYLDGEPLADMLEDRGALPPELVNDVALQLCDGLAAAHAQQIVHRDLKPDNITLITQGGRENFCKILDFGIAKVSSGTSNTKLTMAGAVFGTPHYMSPEQAAGAAVDHRTAIYSLGVMLYEMASGEMPFNADNFMGILTQHMYKAPVPIRALVRAPDCPPGLEAIILKCLSKKPDARYQTTEELAADIRMLQTTGVPNAVQEMMARSGSFNVPADYFKANAPAVVPATPGGMRPRMGPKVVAAVGVAVAVLAVLVIMFRDSTGTAETKAAPTQTQAASAPPPPTASATTPASTKDGVAVLLYAEPAKAVAFVAGKRLKLPDTVLVPKGETLSVVIEAGKKYESKSIELDGTKTKVKVTLEKKGKKGTGKAPRTHTPRVIKTSKPKDDGVRDPWGKKKN